MTSRFARARPFFSGRYYTRSNETPSTSPKSSTGAKPVNNFDDPIFFSTDDGVDRGIMNSDIMNSNRSTVSRSQATPRRKGGRSKTASDAIFSSEASEEPVRTISGSAQDRIFSSLMDSEDPHQLMQSGAARLLQTQGHSESEDRTPRSPGRRKPEPSDMDGWTTTSTVRPASKQRSRTAAPERPGTTPTTTRDGARPSTSGGRSDSGSSPTRRTGSEKVSKKQTTADTRVNLPMLMKDDPPTADPSPKHSISLTQKRRQLSFVDASIECIGEAIEDEHGGLDWLQDFWSTILLGTPTAVCKTLALRSLGNWVSVFNRWQEIGKWVPGQAPNCLNAFEMQELLAIPMAKVLEFVKLFDPSSYARLQMMKATQDYNKVRLNMPAFLTACIWMSTSISKKQKIRFLLGVFDENDSYTFEEVEFVAMLVALFRGVGAIFGLTSRDAMPSHARMQTLARKLFVRVLELGEHRLEGPSKVLLQNGSVPFHIVEEWLLGETYDPLNVPIALFMERFSVPGEEEDPEQFEDEERKFRVSHTHPVEPPMETAASLDGSFLCREEVVQANVIFQHCASKGTFDISHADAERIAGVAIDPKFWIGKLHRALDELDAARHNGVKVSLSTFLKKLCPKAANRHLRMFHSWLKEYEHMDELRAAVVRSREMVASFKAYTAKYASSSWKALKPALQSWTSIETATMIHHSPQEHLRRWVKMIISRRGARSSSGPTLVIRRWTIWLALCCRFW